MDQEKAIEAARQQGADEALKNVGATAGQTALGVDAVGEDDELVAEETGTAFDALVAKFMEGGMNRQKAVAAASRKSPAAHRAFLLATNSGSKQRRELNEKYEVTP